MGILATLRHEFSDGDKYVGSSPPHTPCRLCGHGIPLLMLIMCSNPRLCKASTTLSNTRRAPCQCASSWDSTTSSNANLPPSIRPYSSPRQKCMTNGPDVLIGGVSKYFWVYDRAMKYRSDRARDLDAHEFNNCFVKPFVHGCPTNGDRADGRCRTTRPLLPHQGWHCSAVCGVVICDIGVRAD
jgi:hypothetical protein